MSQPFFVLNQCLICKMRVILSDFIGIFSVFGKKFHKKQGFRHHLKETADL